MFESTGAGGFQLLIPIIVTVLVAKTVGGLFTGPIFDEMIKANDYPYLALSEEVRFQEIASDIGRPVDFALEQNGNTLGSLSEFLGSNSFSGFPVVDNNMQRLVVGYVSRQDLRQALAVSKKRGWSDDVPAILVVHPGDEVDDNAADLSAWVDMTPLTGTSSLIDSRPQPAPQHC